jgi:hypothetical protein
VTPHERPPFDQRSWVPAPGTLVNRSDSVHRGDAKDAVERSGLTTKPQRSHGPNPPTRKVWRFVHSAYPTDRSSAAYAVPRGGEGALHPPTSRA